MTTAELRQFAKDTLDGLPPEQLKVAAEFLRYLDEPPATKRPKSCSKSPGCWKT